MRFLRLGIVAALAYGLLFRVLHPWMFGTFFRDLTRDLTAERSAFAVRLALYGVFAVALAACNLVLDYAKVRTVVEDRRSILGALNGADRFLRRNGAAAAALYLSDALMFAAVLAAYALVAPGAGRPAGRCGWDCDRTALRAGAAVGEARLLGVGDALFQGRLAHAGYAAAARPMWPDSPAAEALGGVTPRTP